MNLTTKIILEKLLKRYLIIRYFVDSQYLEMNFIKGRFGSYESCIIIEKKFFIWLHADDTGMMSD